MRKLLILFTLLFSTLMFSSPSYAKWTKVGVSVKGNTFYVDFERMRKHGGYVYFWSLTDNLKPTKHEVLSVKVFRQGDCRLFRYKVLSVSFYKEPMGGGNGNPFTPPDKWEYAPPDSVSEDTLNSVCNYVK